MVHVLFVVSLVSDMVQSPSMGNNNYESMKW